MKKQLPKIAIHAKSWSKGMKIAVDFLRSKSETVIKRKEEVNANFNILCNGYDTDNTIGKDWEYEDLDAPCNSEFIHLTMPADFEKLKSYFEESTKQAYEAQQEPKFEVGKWYMCDGFFGLITGMLSKNEYYCNGFRYEKGDYEWFSDLCVDLDGCVDADMTKVKELLIKEAEKRGFKEGVKFKCENFYPAHRLKLPFSFHPNYGNTLYGENQMGWIFCESTGKWATIVEEKEQHKTPSEAINSPKRLAKQIEKLERRVIELKEENEELKNDILYSGGESKNLKIEIEKLRDENGKLKSQLCDIAKQPEIIEQVKKMITE